MSEKISSSVGGITTVLIALAFAAISATTELAGTIAELHQYRAKDSLSTTLLAEWFKNIWSITEVHQTR